ncbi:MAG: thrombospondin type 3 repeat-containing protein [candidate division SR1 bacterium]|nr:thrombospondin type 3 repeat-containing protein [candidate division SR1 bacterium]
MNICTSSTKKIRKKTGIFSLFGFLVGVLFPILVQADFNQNLKDMNIDVAATQTKKSVSRYELAKLLNASECKDCILPKQDMIDTYKITFRDTFTKQPGNYFSDIGYLGGIYNQQNYYYCVAYVGDNEYMNGYPASTSPICAGKFCGAQNTTKAEFLQVVINLLAKYIYPNIQIDWKQAQNRVTKLKPDSYESRTLTTDDKQIILDNSKSCKETNCYLTEAKQVATYLKYCMFNLAICGMQPLGNIKQGAWPVAELNLLNSQNIITRDASQRKDIGTSVDGQTVIDILEKVNGKIQCQMNNDYDCDGLDNPQDSCPNAYNPSQTDTDHDGIGDVCDDDIDGDGIKNPVGIVDDHGRINSRLRTGSMDNCLFIPNANQIDSNGNYIGDACDTALSQNALGIYITTKEIASSAPVTVTFDAITQGKVDRVLRNFGDGNSVVGQQVSYTFSEPGIYRVQAVAENTSQQASAQLVIKVGGISEMQSALQAKANKLGSYNAGEFSLQSSTLGNADSIEWIIDKATPIKKTITENLSTILNKTGTHTILLKAYSNNQLLAVSMFNIGVGEFPGAMFKADMLNPELNQEVTFQTTTFAIKPADISYIYRDFGDGTTTQNRSLSTTHTFSTAGKKAAIQKIMLINGTTLTNMITLFVVDKSLLRSYALMLTPSKLSASIGEKISFTSYKVGDSRENIQGYMMKYNDEKSQNLSGTIPLPLTTNYSYTNNGNASPSISAFLNQCTYVQAQATIHIQGIDACLQAKINGTVNKVFKCDLDKDGIPDMCDDDIDGDGKPNLIGLLKYENKDCSFTNDNINLDLLNEHFKSVCTLDNAPFSANQDQLDLNGDGIGDADTRFTGTQTTTDTDTDGDGVLDTQDLCPLINGMGATNGCPEVGNCAPNDPATIQATCNQCPCQYTDFVADLANGDQVQAILRDKQKTIIYNYSQPWIINF